MTGRRKYKLCQKCGNPFTHNEHIFSKWCVNCNPKATIMKPAPPPKPRMLDHSEYEIRFYDVTLVVRCKCGGEVDISPKIQPFEMKCPKCGTLFEPRLEVYEHKVIG